MNKLSRMLLVVASTVVILGAMYSPTFASPEVPSTSSAPDTPIPSASTITSPTPTPTPTATPTSTPTTNPSQSPSTTPSLGASLEGYAYITSTKVGIPDVEVTLYQRGNTGVSVKTNSDGYYVFPNVYTGSATIKAEGASLSMSSKVISLRSGKNTYDLELDIQKPNTVIGYTSYSNKSDAPGITIKISDKKTKKVIGKTLTDANGLYEFSSPLLAAQTKYLVEPWKDDTKLVGTATEISFSASYGEKITKNFTISEKLNYQYTLEVYVTDAYTKKPISGASVYMKNSVGWDSSSSTKSTDKYGIAKFAKVQAGKYTIEVKKKGYTDYSNYQAATILAKPDAKSNIAYVELYPTTTVTGCEKHSQKNVTEFWFCGDAAKKIYKERPELWPAIDNQIGELRSAYPKYNALPLQLIISSDTRTNAQYAMGKEGDGSISSTGCLQTLPTPNTTGPNLKEENIEMTTGFIYYYKTVSEINHTIIHEFGHGVDWRKNKCSGEYWSNSNDEYDRLVRYGSLFSQYFPVLKDSAYHPNAPKKGHPGDIDKYGYIEVFASAFHDGYAHMSEFNSKANATGLPLANVLKRTVQLSTEK